MKLLAAILVVVVQVAGPWLCCCGPFRLVGKPTPRVQSAEVPACSHCKAPAKRSCEMSAKHFCCGTTTEPEQEPSDHCKECCLAIAPAPALVPPPLSVPVLFETPGEFLTVAELGLTSPLLTAVEEHPLPFLPVEAKLFEHHVLRC